MSVHNGRDRREAPMPTLHVIAAMHVLCRQSSTGERFEGSGNRTPRTAQNAFGQTAAFDVGVVRAPVFQRVGVRRHWNKFVGIPFWGCLLRHVRAALAGPSSMYWSTVFLPSNRR